MNARTIEFTIKEITNGWAHNGSGIIATDKLPGAKVGDTWLVKLSGFKVISAKKKWVECEYCHQIVDQTLHSHS